MLPVECVPRKLDDAVIAYVDSLLGNYDAGTAEIVIRTFRYMLQESLRDSEGMDDDDMTEAQSIMLIKIADMIGGVGDNNGDFFP